MIYKSEIEKQDAIFFEETLLITRLCFQTGTWFNDYSRCTFTVYDYEDEEE